MNTLTLTQMSLFEGGVTSPCSTLGKINDVIGVVGAGLVVVAMVSTGPVGLVAGALGGSLGIAGGASAIGSIIACW